MGYSKWEQLGNDLMQSIGYAIETGDFASLNQTVSDTIGQAVNNFTGSGRNPNASYQNTQGANQHTYSQGAYNSGTYSQGTGYGQNTSGSNNNYSYNRNSSNSGTYTQSGQYHTGGTAGQYPSTRLYKSMLGTQVGGACMLLGGAF
ncbi:MAG: hypothetical protein LIO37_00880, partial [Clostridiales bacterium]|nr:hypothetical protein [Clostridiales bacterium]